MYLRGADRTAHGAGVGPAQHKSGGWVIYFSSGLCVLPQAKGEWQAFTLPAASSVELGTQKETVLCAAVSQLEDTLEARCREELGAEVTIRIELEETVEGVQVHSLTVTPMGEAEETRDAVEELLQHTLGVSPVWDVPGGENTP